MSKLTDGDQAHQIALRRLSVRARSCGELRQDLIDRHVEESLADQIVERCLRAGLLDDKKFAESWVSSRQRTRSMSAKNLRRELSAKQVSEDIITEAIAGGEDDIVLALDFARRRVSSLHRYDQETKTRRLSGQLERRGFSYSVIRQALEAVLDEPEIGILDTDE